MDCLPSCLLSKSRCLQHRKKDKLYAKARELLVSELDVVKIIQLLRFYNLAVQMLLSPNIVEEIVEVSDKRHLRAQKKHKNRNLRQQP